MNDVSEEYKEQCWSKFVIFLPVEVGGSFYYVSRGSTGLAHIEHNVTLGLLHSPLTRQGPVLASGGGCGRAVHRGGRRLQTVRSVRRHLAVRAVGLEGNVGYQPGQEATVPQVVGDNGQRATRLENAGSFQEEALMK